MPELCDEQNEEHEKSLAAYRGFPGSKPLPEHHRHAIAPFEGRDPDVMTEEYYQRGYDIYDFEAPIEDMRLVGPYRLLIRFGPKPKA